MRKSTILLVIPEIEEKFSRSRELGVEQAIA